MDDAARIAEGLTEAQRKELPCYRLPLSSNTACWRNPHRPLVAAALFRKGLLARARQGENPIHEPAREWWIYQMTPLGEQVRAILMEASNG